MKEGPPDWTLSLPRGVRHPKVDPPARIRRRMVLWVELAKRAGYADVVRQLYRDELAFQWREYRTGVGQGVGVGDR